MINMTIKCERCNVELEELCVVNFNKNLGEEDSEWFWIMLWGGEVRRYLAHQCPKCGELFFFRARCERCNGTGIEKSKFVPVYDRKEGLTDFVEDPIFCIPCKGTGWENKFTRKKIC